MPTYTYRCSDDRCDGLVETQQRVSEPPLDRCPECAKHSLDRVIYPVGAILKGSGWAKDGYA